MFDKMLGSVVRRADRAYKDNVADRASQTHQGRPPVSHILGYARVSTDDQDLAGQRQRLQAIGALRIFEDVISGKTFERPGLAELLDYIRPGDTLAVVRLDRLGRDFANCSTSSRR